MSLDREVKEAFLRLLREDAEFKDEIRKLIAPDLATREDLEKILLEIKQLREDFNRMEAEIKQLREDFNRMEAEIKQLREDFQAEIKQLREDFTRMDLRMTEGFQRLDNRISALGDRWGRHNEKTVLKALKEFFEDRFNVKVETWYAFDEKGIVHGHPSDVEVDIVIYNDEHWLIEYTSRAKRSDVSELLRISQFYEEKVGIKPARLYIVSPFVDEDAMKLAGMLGIHVITY